MEIKNNEKQRAVNIIWNISRDYSVNPEFKAFDEDGSADLYLNYIIGAVRKYYDYSMLERFFSSLKGDRNYDLYKDLLWLGLENCAYERGKAERPATKAMRHSYSQKILDSSVMRGNDIFNRIQTAHFQRVLGQEPILKDKEMKLLNSLEFDRSMSTEQIVDRMNEIFRSYFKSLPSGKKRDDMKKASKAKAVNLGNKGSGHYFGLPFARRADVGNAEYSGKISGEESKNQRNEHSFRWLVSAEHKEAKLKEYMESYFGASIYGEKRTKDLEQLLCNGNHKDCHLHFTQGKFEGKSYFKREAEFRKQSALEQMEKNKKFYRDNLARNNNSIARLTNKIKNAMLVNLSFSPDKSKEGILDAGKVWRNLFLDDKRVFVKNINEDMGNMTVDIMLDGSSSQLYRQEVISTQGYIIAESFTRCNIPVKVYSFCSLRNYTIFNIFRDYSETGKNANIFNYSVSGNNRDGLAIRTALHMAENNACMHKILIILSDSKPNDTHGISKGGGAMNMRWDYSEDMGVRDTAAEVRKGRQKGISVICVFTGMDEDVPAAKKIYGSDFARIKTPERFADIVGVLIQNQIRNL